MKIQGQEGEIEELRKDKKRKEELALIARDLKRQLEDVTKQIDLTRAVRPCITRLMF